VKNLSSLFLTLITAGLLANSAYAGENTYLCSAGSAKKLVELKEPVGCVPSITQLCAEVSENPDSDMELSGTVTVSNYTITIALGHDRIFYPGVERGGLAPIASYRIKEYQPIQSTDDKLFGLEMKNSQISNVANFSISLNEVKISCKQQIN
jgi:hypothetical protein